MNPLRTCITPPEYLKSDFWIKKIVLRHLMPQNKLEPFRLDNVYFLTYYHRPIQVIDNHGFKSCDAGTFIIWQKDGHIIQGHQDQQWENSYIILGGPFADELLANFPCNQALAIKDHDNVLLAFDTIFQELSEFDPIDKRIVRNLTENLVRSVMRDTDVEHQHSRIPSEYLAAKQFIADNYARSVQVPTLAEKVGVSVAHFSKRFKHYFSCSPGEYLLTIRMEQAMYLMRIPDLTLSKIAQMVGFDNIHYFSRIIKKHYGESPRLLRQKLINKG